MKQVQDETKPAEVCERVELRIYDLLDARQPLLSDDEVRKHVAVCDQCAQLVVDFGALEDSLSQIPLETLHRLSGIQDAEPESQNNRVHPVFFVASVACLLLVMLTSGLWRSGESGDSNLATAVVSSDSSRDFAESEMFGENPNLMPGELISMAASDLSRQVDDQTVQNCLFFAADLPGFRRVSRSVNVTLHLLQGSSETRQESKSEKTGVRSEEDTKSGVQKSPDVGFRAPFRLALA